MPMTAERPVDRRSKLTVVLTGDEQRAVEHQAQIRGVPQSRVVVQVLAWMASLPPEAWSLALGGATPQMLDNFVAKTAAGMIQAAERRWAGENPGDESGDGEQ